MNPARGMILVLAVVLALGSWGPVFAVAQESDPEPAETAADSLQVDIPQESTPHEPIFQTITNEPKAGAKANVRQYMYYTDLVTNLKFQKNSILNNTFKWSWEDYRKQDKTVQKRDNNFSYGLGDHLPLAVSLTAGWNWSEDRTTNTAGYANLSKRDQVRGAISAMKPNFRTGFLINTVKASARIADQKSINQNQRNDFKESALDGGLQTAANITEGVSVAGRVYGMTLGGTRALGETTSPSSASGDTLGLGVYYNRPFGSGRVSVTRSNFDKKYLDFRKNSNGLIDTVGVAEDRKIVSELETTDAISYELENNFRFRRIGFETRLTRVSDDNDFAQSGVGLRQKEQDVMDLAVTFAADRDSFAVSYDYLWKWDDQRYKNATENRGKQYTKSRDYEFKYFRDLFKSTRLNFRYHEGLSQNIAQNEFNDNDQDRHQSDLSARLERNWVGKFRASMVFAYQQVEDLNIRESRSSNNNVKDSYELSPGYSWTISRRLSLEQSYRVYIQYTNYVYSRLESVNRSDDYNKRGNLATKVVILPTSRLNITLRHDYNKRFAATKTNTDATGNPYYKRNLSQTVSKIELAMTFKAVQGVTLEASTYRTRDDRETFGVTDTTTRTYSGEMWVGSRVSTRWFKKNPLELSALVKKYNAFGPSVTETSSDYWEADIYLKWKF